MPPKRKADAVSGHVDSADSLQLPPITPDILQFRVDTGNMGKFGGQRGSLTRCAQKLGALQRAQQEQENNKDDDEDATRSASVATAKQELARELQVFELEMTKMILQQQQRDKQVQSNTEILETRQAEISELQQTVSASAKQAHHALSQRSALAEYEALAKLILEKHPVGQDELQQQIANIQQQSQALDEEMRSTAEATQVRSAQFSLLIQYMNDLKRSLNEDDKEDKNPSGKRKESGDDAMDVDDGDLYGDLSNAKRKEG